MVTIDSVSLDALVACYLVPSAPDGLVGEVRSYLKDGDLSAMPAFSSHKERERNGHGGGPLPEFSPWQLLHVTKSAPAGVVDVAYRFWRRSHAPVAAPDAAPDTAPDAAPDAASDAAPDAAPAGPTPAPERLTVRAPERPANDQAAAYEPRADADHRMSALGAGMGGAPLVERSCALAAAVFIESVSGEHRFGIGGRPLRIGVDPGCDVRVPDGGPNLDARIWLHGDRYMLHVATGVVLVNGASANWAVLDDGDILEIGHATFRFRREDT